MPDCAVAAVLDAGGRELAEPRLSRLAEALRAGPLPEPGTAPAAARYHRVGAALMVAAELAATPDGAGVAALLRGDDMVAARLRLAAETLGPGVTAAVDAAGADLVARAAAWQRYARGPVTPLSAACAADITRGLLRRWACGRQGRRTHLARARVVLLGRARSSCAALRAEAVREVALVGGRRSVAVRSSVEHRAQQLANRFCAVVDWELAGAGAPAAPIVVEPPPLRTARAEHRLTTLLGTGFGVGAALTLARVLGELTGGQAAPVTVTGGVLGLAAGSWVARTRRVLTERARLEGWVVELTTGLRAAMDEYVALRVLAAAAQTAD